MASNVDRETALKFRIPIGKYKGQTLGQTWGQDSAYILWCFKNWNQGKNKPFFWACSVLGIGFD